MPLNLAKLKEKKERSGGTGYSPKEGSNPIRILPHTALYFTQDMSEFCHEFRSHFIRIPGADMVITRCLRDKPGESCPVCQAYQEYRENPDPEVAKLANDLKGGYRYIFNILALNDLNAGIQHYETGPMVYNAILEYLANPNWGDMINPANGRNWTLVFTPQNKSSSGFNHYAMQPDPQLTNAESVLPANYKELLDATAVNVPGFMETPALMEILQKLGLFPGKAAVAPAGVSMPAAGVMPVVQQMAAPTPVQQPAAVAAPVQAMQPVQQMETVQPVTMPVATPVTMPIVQPVAVATPQTMAAPTPTPTVAAAAGGATVVSKVYPPGLEINPLEGVPVCFGEYDPQTHPCEACPDMSDCVVKTLGVG